MLNELDFILIPTKYLNYNNFLGILNRITNPSLRKIKSVFFTQYYKSYLVFENLFKKNRNI